MSTSFPAHCLRLAATLVTAAPLAAREGTAGGAHVDPKGRLECLELDGELVPIRTDVRVFTPGWKRSVGLWNARDVKRDAGDGGPVWRGRVEVAPGQSCRYRVALREGGKGDDGNTDDKGARLETTLTAESDVAAEGVIFWVEMPLDVFRGGRARLSSRGAETASVAMSVSPPGKTHVLGSGDADRITVEGRGGDLVLSVALDRARHVQVQDSRKWNAQHYGLFISMHGGSLGKGQSVSIEATLGLRGKADRGPAELSLDARERLYRLDGIGGNYCFNIESPQTDYTLSTLRVAWARTEMTLAEWEPRNDDGDPRSADRGYFESQDKPGSNLRRELELMRKIQERDIPYCVSIWDLPDWMYADPRKPPRSSGRRVADDGWPELLESIGAYLLHAQRRYAAEPDLFSFNEPDWGVRVRLSPEEHRDAVIRIGSHLRSLGLRTRMLLADVTNPRGTVAYAEPTASSPQAVRHLGAVGFHSWGGASPDQYREWSDLARRLDLPLLVTELGVDAEAWRSRSYDTWPYALRELRLYQELLLHARPQGTMQWEYTADYAIVEAKAPGAGTPPGAETVFTPTKRYWFVRHFSNLTPPGAEALATRSSRGEVLFTAFVSPGRRGSGETYVLHIANLGAARAMRLTGLPRQVRRLYPVVTGAEDSYLALPPVAVRGGEARTELAAQSLTTLATGILDPGARGDGR